MAADKSGTNQEDAQGPENRPGEEWLIDLGSKAAEARRGEIGSKAAGLALLTREGFHVPRAFCLSTAAYEEFLENLPRKGKELLKRVQNSQEEEGELEELREIMLTGDLPRLVLEALELAWCKLGGVPVAVRSSGTMEDLEEASFAGQYETFLEVTDLEAVVDSVRRCWVSAWNNRVLGYCQRNGLPLKQLSMAVILQQMVQPRVSGVLFTLHPQTGRDDEMLAEAVPGLGEALVSGRVNPSRYVLEWHSGKLKEKMGQGDEILSSGELQELGQMGRDLHALLGAPQDVEWSFDLDGHLWALQTRPITRIGYAPGLGEWTTADFRDGGVSSSVVSPFMWSLYDRIWHGTLPAYVHEIRLLPDELKSDLEWGRVFFGRPYWNVGAVKRCLANAPGFNEREFDSDLSIEITYEGDGLTVPMTVTGALKALPSLLALYGGFRKCMSWIRRFHQEFWHDAALFQRPHLARLTDGELAVLYDRLLNGLYVETESAYFRTIYNTSNAKLVFKESFDSVNRMANGEFSWLNLMLGLRNLSHLRPVTALWDLAASIEKRPLLKQAVAKADPVDLPSLLEGLPESDRLEQFLLTYGYHGTRELDILRPRWREQPREVYSTLQKLVLEFDPKRDPRVLNEAQHRRYLEERTKLETFLRQQPGWRWVPGRVTRFLAGLQRVRKFCWWREEMRDLSTRAYDLVRRYTVEVGRRVRAKGVLDQADDLFFLRHQEALDLLAGRLDASKARALVVKNRRYCRAWRNFKNPNEIGDRYQWRRKATRPPQTSGEHEVLQGVACSPGRVRATARVIRSLDESNRVNGGDALITLFTDPGWTPLLGRVGAVVTETGGLLSHAAVISREYGLPAVLAVPGATEKIPDGAMIIVDGDRGLVEILAEEE